MTDGEAETSILRPPDVKNWFIWKDPDAGKDWRQEEKRTTDDEMVGWHHWLYGREYEQAPGAGDGQGGLAWCSPCGHKELDTTEWLNWTVVKNLPANAEEASLIPGSGRSPGEGNGNPLQYSCLENPMVRGSWGLESMGFQRVGYNLVIK